MNRAQFYRAELRRMFLAAIADAQRNAEQARDKDQQQ